MTEWLPLLMLIGGGLCFFVLGSLATGREFRKLNRIERATSEQKTQTTATDHPVSTMTAKRYQSARGAMSLDDLTEQLIQHNLTIPQKSGLVRVQTSHALWQALEKQSTSQRRFGRLVSKVRRSPHKAKTAG